MRMTYFQWCGMFLVSWAAMQMAAIGEEQADPNVLWHYSFDKLKLADDPRQGWASPAGPNQVAVELIPGAARLRKTASTPSAILLWQAPVDCRPESAYRYKFH